MREWEQSGHKKRPRHNRGLLYLDRFGLNDSDHDRGRVRRHRDCHARRDPLSAGDALAGFEAGLQGEFGDGLLDGRQVLPQADGRLDVRPTHVAPAHLAVAHGWAALGGDFPAVSQDVFQVLWAVSQDVFRGGFEAAYPDGAVDGIRRGPGLYHGLYRLRDCQNGDHGH